MLKVVISNEILGSVPLFKSEFPSAGQSRETILNDNSQFRHVQVPVSNERHAIEKEQWFFFSGLDFRCSFISGFQSGFLAFWQTVLLLWGAKTAKWNVPYTVLASAGTVYIRLHRRRSGTMAHQTSHTLVAFAE